MSEKNQIISTGDIQNKIYTVRGLQVMLDSDLASLYGVETKNLNLAVKRNVERFPDQFRFQLTNEEWKSLRSQIATLNNSSLRLQNETLKTSRGKHRKYLPYVFTEQGVAMLSAVLRSQTAVNVSIQIMQAFVEMKQFITINAGIFQRLDKVEQKLILHDDNFNQLFKALEDKTLTLKQDIFFNGQIFDAYTFVSDLIRGAKKSVILIDNYIDDTVLTLFSKRKHGVKATIFTGKISRKLLLDLEKFNAQYEPVEVKVFKEAHDRFLILDEKEVYHFGASLKDLGKKWFAFSKMDIASVKVLDKLAEQNFI